MDKERYKEEVFRFADKSDAVHLTLFPALLDLYKGGEEGIVKSIIKDFCRDARNMLEKAGIQINQNENVKQDAIALYLEGEGKDILLSNAGRVIGSANDCCAAIEKGNAESAAIEMLRLCFAITSMAMRETILQGIGTKAGQTTGGKKSRKLKGIEAAIKKRLQEKVYTAGELWGYFSKYETERALRIGEYEIYIQRDHANNKNPKRLYQIDEAGKEQSINFKTFESYTAEIKKDLQEKEIIKEILSIYPDRDPDITRQLLFPSPKKLK